MRLELRRGPGCGRLPRGVLPVLEDLAQRLRPARLGVQVVVGDDAMLRRLNRDFRARDRSTDVLSFLYEQAPPSGHGGSPSRGAAPRRGRGLAPAGGEDPDAEVYVSLPRARMQARECGHSLAAELAVLVLHGLLHLQGHDHHTLEGARRMHAAETRSLAWMRRRWPRLAPEPLLGWGPPARQRAALGRTAR